MTHSLAILKGTELEKYAAWFLFFVIVWKLIQDSRYDREPNFSIRTSAFCRLVAFQHSYGRKVFTTINQSKLQKSNIQHGKLFKNIGLVHSEFSIRLFMLTFSIHDFFFEVLNLHRFVVNLQECIDLKKIMHNKFKSACMNWSIDLSTFITAIKWRIKWLYLF